MLKQGTNTIYRNLRRRNITKKKEYTEKVI